MCNNEGQVVYNKGSTVQDRRCRCDHTKGYSFVKSTRKDVCSCSPTYDDCSCYHTRCKKGYILSPGKIIQSLTLCNSHKFKINALNST